MPLAEIVTDNYHASRGSLMLFRGLVNGVNPSVPGEFCGVETTFVYE